MPDDTRIISIQTDATAARNQLVKVGQALNNVSLYAGQSAKTIRQAERAIKTAADASARGARTIQGLKDQLKAMGRETTANQKSMRALQAQLETANVRFKTQQAVIRLNRSTIRALTNENERLRAANSALAKSADVATNGLRRQGQAARAAGKDLHELNDTVQDTSLRYALYDVSSSLGGIRDAGVAALGDLLGTAISFERDFANVIRTSQVSNPAMFENTEAATRNLQEAFLDLQSTLPVSSEELTRIGTLAAQMGVAASELAEFTETTAKFSAASGVSAEEAATALSRLGMMLSDDVKGDFDALASSILKTGVNAIATEQQIVRGSTQIAAIGNVAGFSADEIIALSSAMSSLGMSPELQRSIITSSFTKILGAVRGSTAAAEEFGAVIGMTGEEFQNAFETDGYNTYNKLLQAIAASPNAIGILQDLGLASQRLTPNLLKMGQATDLFNQTLRDTESSHLDETSELTRQYAVIAETTASKLQILSQAWDAFLSVIGSDTVGIIGDVAGAMSSFLGAFRDFINSAPGAKNIVNSIIFVAALGTGVLALTSAVTLAGASLLGFQFVIKQLALSAASATASTAGATAGITGMGIASTITSGSLKLLTLSLRALAAAAPVLVAVSAALQMDSDLTKTNRDIQGLSSSFKDLKAELTGAVDTKDFSGIGRAFEDIKNGAGNGGLGAVLFKDVEVAPWVASIGRTLGGFSGQTWGNIKLADEQLASLADKNAPAAAKELEELRESWLASGQTNEAFAAAFPDSINALALMSGQTGATAEELDTYYQGLEETTNAEELAAISASSLGEALFGVKDAYRQSGEALENYMSAFQSGAGSFFNVDDLISNAYGTDKGQGGGLSRLKKDLDNSLDDFNKWQRGISTLTARGAGSFATAMAAQGPASQQAVSDALKLSDSALGKINDSFADAAFFASDVFADAFASQNGVLADVYKKALAIDPKTALDALHETRDILNKNGALSGTDIANLQVKYGIELDPYLNTATTAEEIDNAMAILGATITPITVPVTTSVGQGDFTVTEEVNQWIVEMEGNTITIDVDPNTPEGAQKIAEWRASEYATPVKIPVSVSTGAAQGAINAFIAANQGIKIAIGAALGALPKVPKNAKGGLQSTGLLHGPGTGTSDSFLSYLSDGEFVARAKAVDHYGPQFFYDLNNLKFPKFASGGGVGSAGGGSSSGGGANVNIEVNQMYPTTVDPIKKMKQDAENAFAGIWD